MYQVSDTNSAQKVCRILRVLSTPKPLRLADISEGSGLNKATTLRLIKTLISEGFVHRREANQRSAPAVERGLFLVPKVIE